VVSIALWLSASCGRVGFSSDGSFSDAGAPPDASSRDAGREPDADETVRDAAMEDAGALPDGGAAMFGTPVLISELSSASDEDDPSLRADLLEIVFNRDSDIYSATRASEGDRWSAPAPVDALNSTSTETSPELAADGLTIYFSSRRDSGELDIWTSTRPTLAAAWAAPVRVPELSSSLLDTNPTISPDGLSLTVCRGVTSTSRDILESRRASPSDPWETPVSRDELDSSANDGGAMLARGARWIVFFSSRAGASGASALYFATRADRTVAFDAPMRIVELDSADDEADPWISEDGSHLVFTRAGDLFEARR
jgi:Tol biopolymer transport system component